MRDQPILVVKAVGIHAIVHVLDHDLGDSWIFFVQVDFARVILLHRSAKVLCENWRILTKNPVTGFDRDGLGPCRPWPCEVAAWS